MQTARALAIAALACALAGCGSPEVTSSADNGPTAKAQTSQAPAKKKSAGVGDVITLKGNDDKLKVAVKLAKVIKAGAAANDLVKADAGKRLFAVELVLKNTGSAAYDDSPGNGAKVVDSEGHEYEASLFGEIRNVQNLGSPTIAAGDARRGAIVFEVPTKAKIVKLQMALNSGFADQKGEWRTS